jgi:uncharacterized protein YjdB
MNNRVLLNQVRYGIALQIAQSPESVTFSARPKKPDGFGGMVEDSSAEPIETTAVCRLSHSKSGPLGQEQMSQGFDTGLSLWLLSTHVSKPIEGARAIARGRLWTVGKPDALEKFGGVTAYQTELYPAGEIASGSVEGISIDQDSPLDCTLDDTPQLTWTITPESVVNTNVSWASGDELVATISADGLVTPVSVGSALMTVTTQDGNFTDSILVQVLS